MAPSSTLRVVNGSVYLRQLTSPARPCRAGASSAEPGGGRASGAAGAALI
jgi:hypothetical protein